ncbi:MAG TPA: PilZ domain-containing protein [Stenomitos sp.]
MKIQIKVGQAIQLLVPSGDRTIPCDATVLAVWDQQFAISTPRRHGVRVPITGDHLSVTFVMPDANYAMRCAILQDAAGGLTLNVPPDDEIQRIQRRQFVRVPSDLPCTIEWQIDPEKGEFGPRVPGKLKDVSGGGVGLLIMPTIPVGTLARLEVELPQHGSFAAYGYVRRCSKQFGQEGGRHFIGLEFINLNEALRSRLVLYVNDIQRDLMRARMQQGAPG